MTTTLTHKHEGHLIAQYTYEDDQLLTADDLIDIFSCKSSSPEEFELLCSEELATSWACTIGEVIAQIDKFLASTLERRKLALVDGSTQSNCIIDFIAIVDTDQELRLLESGEIDGNPEEIGWFEGTREKLDYWENLVKQYQQLLDRVHTLRLDPATSAKVDEALSVIDFMVATAAIENDQIPQFMLDALNERFPAETN